MLLLTFLVVGLLNISQTTGNPWRYTCENGQDCIRQEELEVEGTITYAECILTCPSGRTLWPYPKSAQMSGSVESVHPDLFSVSYTVANQNQVIIDRLERAVERQTSFLYKKQISPIGPTPGTKNMAISISVAKDTESIVLTNDESYNLKITRGSGMRVDIVAQTFQGARHAIETLFQLIEWDDQRKTFLVVDNVQIEDNPYYPHRGIMVDTSRQFISTGKIKEVIDSLSFSKMNVFHWHITDSASFPLEVESHPEMANYGAYREDMIYSRQDLKDIATYATDRGVVVIPEVDAPGHTGPGWEAFDPEFMVCSKTCTQFPCGQLNPAAPGMYDILQDIYRELVEAFGSGHFHMGGDEVNIWCWLNYGSVIDWFWAHGLGGGDNEENLYKMWAWFENEAVRRLDEVSDSPPQVYLWTGPLTLPKNLKYINSSRFAIELWSNAEETSGEAFETIQAVAEGGFKMVFTNFEQTYLDLGYGGWLYRRGMAKVYEDNPYKILERHNINNFEEAEANVMGGEIGIWTEMTDDSTLLLMIEPRTAAYGEVLWTDPRTIGSWDEASDRMIRHRERLQERGVGAETLENRWCLQNPDGRCPNIA